MKKLLCLLFAFSLCITTGLITNSKASYILDDDFDGYGSSFDISTNGYLNPSGITFDLTDSHDGTRALKMLNAAQTSGLAQLQLNKPVSDTYDVEFDIKIVQGGIKVVEAQRFSGSNYDKEGASLVLIGTEPSRAFSWQTSSSTPSDQMLGMTSGRWYRVKKTHRWTGTTRNVDLTITDILDTSKTVTRTGLSDRNLTANNVNSVSVHALGLNNNDAGNEIHIDNYKIYSSAPDNLDINFQNASDENLTLEDGEGKSIKFIAEATDTDANTYPNTQYNWTVKQLVNDVLSDAPSGVQVSTEGLLIIPSTLPKGEYQFVVKAEIKGDESIFDEKIVNVTKNAIILPPDTSLSNYIANYKIKTYQEDGALVELAGEKPIICDDIIFNATGDDANYKFRTTLSSGNIGLVANDGMVKATATATDVILTFTFEVLDYETLAILGSEQKNYTVTVYKANLNGKETVLLNDTFNEYGSKFTGATSGNKLYKYANPAPLTFELVESYKKSQEKALQIFSADTDKNPHLQINSPYSGTYVISFDAKFASQDFYFIEAKGFVSNSTNYDAIGGALSLSGSTLKWIATDEKTVYENIDPTKWYHVEIVNKWLGSSRIYEVSVNEVGNPASLVKRTDLSARNLASQSNVGLHMIGFATKTAGNTLLLDNYKYYQPLPENVTLTTANTNITLNDGEEKTVTFTASAVSKSGIALLPAYIYSVTQYQNNVAVPLEEGVSVSKTGVLTLPKNLYKGNYTFIVKAQVAADAEAFGTSTINVTKNINDAAATLNHYAENYVLKSYNKDGTTYALTGEKPTVSDNILFEKSYDNSSYKFRAALLSDQSSIINEDGIINPTSTATDIHLTVTIEILDYKTLAVLGTKTKVFIVSAILSADVRKAKLFDYDLIEFNKISFPAATTSKLTFPTKLTYGSEITWNTSNLTSISNIGIVTRNHQSVTVTIHAVMSNGIENAERTFPVVTVTGTGGTVGTGSTGTGSKGSSVSSGSTYSVASQPVVTPAPVEITEAKTPFADLGDVSWAVEAIEYLYENKIVNGISETEFDPNSNMTKAEILKILVIAFDLETDKTDMNFNDVSDSDWYKDFVKTAYNLGIAEPVSEEFFGANSELTREDLCVILYNTLNIKDYTFNERTEFVFKDDDKISDNAKEAVYALYDSKIVQGVGDDMFDPSSHSTRAALATLIYRILNEI